MWDNLPLAAIEHLMWDYPPLGAVEHKGGAMWDTFAARCDGTQGRMRCYIM